MGFISALIVLHRAYQKFPLRSRVHILIRFITCPFLRVVKHVPAGARVLDVGAGHGIFSVLARERGAHVTAVDPDGRKVRRFDRIRTVIGFDDCIRGTFDVIALNDVLYKIPIAEWDALLDRLKRRLAPGGTLLIKEHDPTARVKQAWNQMQERIASALHLTLGESFSYETPADFERRLRAHGFEPTHARIDRGYPHAHVLYIGRAISSAR